MSKVAVVCWSRTGNTAAMAGAVEAGAKDNGTEGLEECRSLGGALA